MVAGAAAGAAAAGGDPVWVSRPARSSAARSRHLTITPMATIRTDTAMVIRLPITLIPASGGAYGTVTAGYGPASNRQREDRSGGGWSAVGGMPNASVPDHWHQTSAQ